MKWSLLAPGHSATQEIADSLHGLKVGVVGCAYKLAPWAVFIAASDAAWWDKYADARAIEKRYGMRTAQGVECVTVPGFKICNSGVLALDVARQLGATEIHLHGFDMHGSHFFGEYDNGLKNATPEMRNAHLREYRQWAASNKNIRVINFTRGSKLDCFPMGV
jgi:hypothetical protein